MVGHTGIMTANREAGMIVYRTAALTDVRVSLFVIPVLRSQRGLTKAQNLAPFLSRTIAVGQNFSFLYFHL
jgi:hypothetical protein